LCVCVCVCVAVCVCCLLSVMAVRTLRSTAPDVGWVGRPILIAWVGAVQGYQRLHCLSALNVLLAAADIGAAWAALYPLGAGVAGPPLTDIPPKHAAIYPAGCNLRTPACPPHLWQQLGTCCEEVWNPCR
jgi:hypothetical protein